MPKGDYDSGIQEESEHGLSTADQTRGLIVLDQIWVRWKSEKVRIGIYTGRLTSVQRDRRCPKEGIGIGLRQSGGRLRYRIGIPV